MGVERPTGQEVTGADGSICPGSIHLRLPRTSPMSGMSAMMCWSHQFFFF